MKSSDTKISEILGQLNLEEKVSLLAGVSGENYMDTTPIERLGIPQLLMADGPHGVRWGEATCFPSGISMAASWNGELVRRFGVALARETRAKGRNVILGPCVNIHRTPLGGRNFESFGEDPYLAGRIAVDYVKGVQSEKVPTSTKHLACNNQEKNRMTVSSEIDERALREIYLPAFKAAVQEADTWTVMGAYNRLNGTYCCENHHLLNDILKDEWGFRGFVVSDWGAAHSTKGCAEGGLDLEMPGPGAFFNEKLQAAVEKGEISEELIDDKVLRILRVMDLMGLLDGTFPEAQPLDKEAHKALALEMAQEAIVLLKNESSVLPFDRTKLRKLAVIGPNAISPRLGGGGSSSVTPHHGVSALEGLQTKCGHDVEVLYAIGCNMPGDLPPIETEALRPAGQAGQKTGLKAEYFKNLKLEGEPFAVRVDQQLNFDWGGGTPVPGMASNKFSARWTGQLIPSESGLYDLGTITTDEMRVYLDGKLVLEFHPEHAAELKTVPVELEAGKTYDLRIEFISAKGWPVAKLGWMLSHDMDHAVALAKEADAAVVVAGISSSFEGEGVDRANMNLPGEQDKLIQAVAAANPNTVVVLMNGTALDMRKWADVVPAIVEAWYPGQEGGHAIADILFGDVNPSGKSVITFAQKLEDYASTRYYPGDEQSVSYAEGIWVGYRHFEREKTEPLFPFGHGLSYTTFDYRDIEVASIVSAEGVLVRVRVEVENTGERPGKEAVQLYVRDVESALERPVKELKAFQKIALQPGEKQTLTFELKDDAFCYYHPKEGWTLEPGSFEVLVGASSADIRLQAGLRL